MDKQPFDHIENRIRKAADEINLPFSDEAWKRMEIKLDNEFNQERRRRGFIWWWFSLILLGFAALGIYVYNSKSINTSEGTIGASSVATVNESLAVTKKASEKTADLIDGKETASTSLPENTTRRAGKEAEPLLKEQNNTGLVPMTTAQQKNQRLNNESSDVHNGNTYANEKKVIKTTKLPVTDKMAAPTTLPLIVKKRVNVSDETYTNGASYDGVNRKEQQGNSEKETSAQNPNTSASGTALKNDSSSSTAVSLLAPDKKAIIQTETKNDSIAAPESASKTKATVKLTPTPSKGIYFLGSVAADITTIKDLAIKESKPVFGFGVGYRFNKKLSVQTGFYFGQKVYTAGPDDYKVKEGSYIAKIISADAECYIYDVPITVRYDVLHKNNVNFYATAGLSTLFLKRETYDIHFFNPTGTYRHMAYTYRHNVSYLSVVNLSLGYEHKLSNSLFIQAEPYLKVPLAGVGEGAVKLYSAGLQMGIKYQPFKKKK